MEITSRDGNMVVDFYPVKDMNNNLIANRMLKVLSFRGDTQKKMLITRQEFYYQVTDNLDNLPQFHNFMKSSGCYYKPYRTLNNY